MFDTIRNATSWYRDPYSFLDQYIARGDYDFRIDLPGSKDAFFVGSPDLLNEVVRNKSLVGGDGLRFVQPFTGPRALIVISGADHQHRRRPIQNSLYQADHPWMIELTEKYFSLVANNLRTQQVFPIADFYQEITLHAIIDYALGVDESEHDEIFGLLHSWIQTIDNPAWIFLKPLQVNLGSLTPWGPFLRGREAVWSWIHERVRDYSGDSRSIIAQLIADRANGHLHIDTDDLVWQCIELLLFGNDTTACGSAWTAMHLLDNSMMQSGELESSAFREACIKEALRVTPIVIHVTRQATEDTHVGGELIRKGQKVFPCAYLAHHHRENHDRPEVYDPGRFMAGRSPARYTYFPFGLGSRICVGMPFGMGQMEVLLRQTLALGQLSKISPEKTRAERKFIIMAPEDGGLVRYESFN
jgi:cytochrome P450